MWVADSDFRSPAEVVSAIARRAEHGIYGYTPESEELKKAAADWLGRRHGLSVDPERIFYCPGVIPGVIYGLRAFSEPGDGIIVQTPCYAPFVQSIERNERVVVRNPLILRDGHYEIDFDGFERLCQEERNTVFILCNPQNPTGRVSTKEELERMAEICRANRVVVLSDEIHSDIVCSGQKHIPFSAVSEAAAENSVTFMAASKTFNVPGLNTAVFYSRNEELFGAMVKQNMANKGYRENIFGTLAFCVCFNECEYYVDELCEYLAENIAVTKAALEKLEGIRVVDPEGTYLLWLDCRGLGLSHSELVDRFVKKAKVGLESGTDFGPEGEGFMRMNIAVPRATLEEALRRICAAF